MPPPLFPLSCMELEDVKTEEDFNNLTLDEQAMLELAVKANAIKRGRNTIISINGRRWKMRPMNNKQAERWSNIDFDVMYWQRGLKECSSRRKAKRLNRKIRKAYARKAVCAWLGRWWFVPGVAWLGWHYLHMQRPEVIATINTIAEIGGGDANFFSANLGCSKRQLVRCMTQVGDVYEEMQKRKQSASDMIAEDASPKKEEESKSGAHLPKARTTRR